MDKEAAANLLAWMMAPETLAEAAYANAMLPTSRTAAQDPRFQEIPGFEVFMALLTHPNAAHTVTTPINAGLNEALGQVEAELLHQGGGSGAVAERPPARVRSQAKGSAGLPRQAIDLSSDCALIKASTRRPASKPRLPGAAVPE
jgi:hypothetical protein